MIARIPPQQIAAITRELLSRNEHVTMGRFVGHLSAEAISSAVAVMDDVSLLQIAVVLETNDGIGELVGLLPPERIDGIVDAATEEDLWPELLDLAGRLSDEHATRLADAAAARDDAVLTSLVTSAQSPRLRFTTSGRRSCR